MKYLYKISYRFEEANFCESLFVFSIDPYEYRTEEKLESIIKDYLLNNYKNQIFKNPHYRLVGISKLGYVNEKEIESLVRFNLLLNSNIIEEIL